VFGEFKDPDGADLAMVVNRIFTRPKEMAFRLHRAASRVDELNKTTGIFERLEGFVPGDMVKLNLKPGEGRLLRFRWK
jgi:hypothetical protein